ncbi:hypothetical protein TCSYLVIO_001349 [Trypanosoma cruzi]|nr:hypothetical protein TCSYLVIO_001349 [Trypanosoma cruzi]RNF22653.1 hypothetical protein TcG_02074 [Trypanosoma cruzi]
MMPRNCVSVFFVLLEILLVLCFVALPVAGAYCVTPTEIPANVCPSFTLTDQLSALFGRDTAVASCYCGRVCQTSWDARQELSLRWEMERWIRANRTAGMFPEEYEFVMDELVRLTTPLRGDEPWHVRQEKELYAKRANATLRDMPWLLVSNGTFKRAQDFYHRNVRQRHIVRSFHLSRETSRPGIIRFYLQEVAGWWAEAEKRVSRDLRVAAPLLPWISLEQLIGPPMTPAEIPQPEMAGRPAAAATKVPAPMQRRSFRFAPARLRAPTAMVYYYSDDCVLCEALGVAFDVLPLIYRRLCEYGHSSIVSCSPLFLFFRASAELSGFRTPAIALHGVELGVEPNWMPPMSILYDIDELVNPADAFGFLTLSVPVNTSLQETLVSLIRPLVALHVINLRYLSSDEITELGRLAYKIMKQKKRQQQQNASAENSSDTKGAILSEDDEGKDEASEERNRDLAWQQGRVITREDYLHEVVVFHMRELWGNSTAEVESNEFLLWSQLEPPWIMVVSSVLSVLWLLILICVPKGFRF